MKESGEGEDGGEEGEEEEEVRTRREKGAGEGGEEADKEGGCTIPTPRLPSSLRPPADLLPIQAPPPTKPEAPAGADVDAVAAPAVGVTPLSSGRTRPPARPSGSSTSRRSCMPCPSSSSGPDARVGVRLLAK